MNNSKNAVILIAFGLVGACSSPHQNATTRDASGNYATTSKYNSQQRTEFATAMSSGLADFDKRRTELESRATKVGQSAVEEFHDEMPKLQELRTKFVNELARLDAALDHDWPARRDDTQNAYDDLRKALDEAYEEVLS